MTTIVPYTPSPTTPFRFSATLDGQAYIATVVWGLFGRRLYLNLTDTGGRLIFSRPMLGSPPGVAIQSLAWQLGIVTLETALPHGFAITDTVSVSIKNCLPEALNGKRNVLVTTATAVTFPLSPDPGNVSQNGRMDYHVDIAAGYFTSSLIYRPDDNQFEVEP